MRPVKTHTFAGRKVDIDIFPDGVDGMVDCPYGTDATPTMHLFKDLNTRDGLETVIHETLHVLWWAKTHDKTEETAQELAKFLWRLGYRLKGD